MPDPASWEATAFGVRQSLAVTTKQVVVDPLPDPLDRRALAEGTVSSPEVVSLKQGERALALSLELP
jgi:hypothetical protein